ncbi:hypothetical protein [Rhizobium jaguaris]|uniref:hypothetical protein n=1 Tax=Rhizobium jaguaris TaxID=1312183 RepID=UPI0013C524A5|nr:hypothetical protein [Rhizobium jaguaris]
MKSLDAELAAINRGAPARPQAALTPSGGYPQTLLLPDIAPAPVQAKKIEPQKLHPKVRPLATTLSADAAMLLSLVVKADEAYKGAQLIDLAALTVKSALGVSEQNAVAARTELERRGLIVFRDNGSGYRGFLPRL